MSWTHFPFPGEEKSHKNVPIMPISQLYYGLTSSETPQSTSGSKRFHGRVQLWMNSLLTQKSHFLSSLLPPSPARHSAENTVVPFLTELSGAEGWHRLQNLAHCPSYTLLCRVLSRIQARKSQNKPTKQNIFPSHVSLKQWA